MSNFVGRFGDFSAIGGQIQKSQAGLELDCDALQRTMLWIRISCSDLLLFRFFAPRSFMQHFQWDFLLKIDGSNFGRNRAETIQNGLEELIVLYTTGKHR